VCSAKAMPRSPSTWRRMHGRERGSCYGCYMQIPRRNGLWGVGDLEEGATSHRRDGGD
jgi:hypothetical protein